MLGTTGRSRCAHALLLAVLLCSVAGRLARAATPQPAATAVSGTPLLQQPSEEHVHDHTPRHRGVVGMAGSRHVEAVLLPGGVLRVYLTDLQRMPLALAGAAGSATITQGAVRTRVDLVVHDDALEARTSLLAGQSVDARIEVTLSGEPLLIDFTLPVGTTP